MGVRGLESFILASKSISTPCNYSEEIKKWRQEHGTDPTILIDLREFSNTISRMSDGTMQNGGIFDEYVNFVKSFLDELKNHHVDFVFFIKERNYFNDDKEKNKLREVACYREDRIITRDNIRINYYITKIAEKYGVIIRSDTRYINVIVNYATEHADKVLSIIGNDTALLIFEGKFQYWPMVKWPNKERLRFDRDALLNKLMINSEQLRLLAALFGMLGNWSKFENKLANAVGFVKNQNQAHANIFDWQQIAGILHRMDRLESQTATEVSKTAETLAECYKEFDKNHRPSVFDNGYREYASRTMLDALKCCNQKHLSIYHAITSCGDRFFALTDLFCLNGDYPTSKDFTDAIFTVLTKISGVFYGNEDPEKRPQMQLFFNPFLNDDGGEIESRNLLYPDNMKINLQNLIIDEDNHAYDEDRWRLLQWILGIRDGFLTKVRNNSSLNMRIISIVLHFLVEKHLIGEKSAKYILHVEELASSRSPCVPRCLAPLTIEVRWPRRIKPEWVQDAHIYGIAYWLVCQALQVSGLRHEMDIIRFNAFKFFDAMENQYWRKSQIEEILFPIERAT